MAEIFPLRNGGKKLSTWGFDKGHICKHARSGPGKGVF